MFKLADLFVQIGGDDSPLNRTLSGIKGRLDQFAAVGAAIFSVEAGQRALGFLNDAVGRASDLGETLDYAGIVFGDQLSKVTGYADEMAAKFGLVKKQTVDVATGFAGIGKGLGKLNGEELVGFSTKLTQIAADLSSAKNISFDEAASALQVVLSGEQSDVLKRLGVITTETTMEQYALAHGIKWTTGAMSEQAKLAIRLGMIQEGLRDTQDNLAKTSDSYANRQRKLAGDWENSLTSLGSAIQPAFDQLMAAGSSALSTLSTWFTQNRETVMGWASTVGEVFATAGVIFRNLGDVAEIFWLTLQEKFLNAGDLFNWFMGVAGQLLDWFGRNWVGVLADAFNAGWAIASNSLNNIGALVKEVWDYITSMGKDPIEWNFLPLLEGFEATVEALPEIAGPAFNSLQDQVDAVVRRMSDRELKLVEDTANKAKAIAGGGSEDLKLDTGPEAKGKKAKDKKAETVGLEQFVSKLQEGAFGKKDEQKKQLEKQTQIEEHTRKAATALSSIAGAVAGGGLSAVAMGPL